MQRIICSEINWYDDEDIRNALQCWKAIGRTIRMIAYKSFKMEMAGNYSTKYNVGKKIIALSFQNQWLIVLIASWLGLSNVDVESKMNFHRLVCWLYGIYKKLTKMCKSNAIYQISRSTVFFKKALAYF